MLKKTKGEESVWSERETERERLWGLKIFNGIIGKVFNVGRMLFRMDFKVKE